MSLNLAIVENWLFRESKLARTQSILNIKMCPSPQFDQHIMTNIIIYCMLLTFAYSLHILQFPTPYMYNFTTVDHLV